MFYNTGISWELSLSIKPGDTIAIGMFPVGSTVVEVAQDPYRRCFNILVDDHDAPEGAPKEKLSVLWNGRDSWIECHTAAIEPAAPAKPYRRVPTVEMPQILEIKKRRINLVDIATA
jgi:hypothetical protein